MGQFSSKLNSLCRRATRSCIERIRTSADVQKDEQYVDSSSADSNESTGRTESLQSAGRLHAGPTEGPADAEEEQPRLSDSPDESAKGSGGAQTPKNTPNGSPERSPGEGSPKNGRSPPNESSPKNGSQNGDDRPSSSAGRPGSEKHPVLPPITSPLPVA